MYFVYCFMFNSINEISVFINEYNYICLQKKCPIFQDESNNEIRNQTQQETEKLKLEQLRVKEEVCDDTLSINDV